jgi:hypothetical protein
MLIEALVTTAMSSYEPEEEYTEETEDGAERSEIRVAGVTSCVK